MENQGSGNIIKNYVTGIEREAIKEGVSKKTKIEIGVRWPEENGQSKFTQTKDSQGKTGETRRMDNTEARRQEIEYHRQNFDIYSLLDEVRETQYENYYQANEIAVQLVNVLSYFGYATYPIRLLRKRLIVTYSYYPEHYFRSIPVRYSSVFNESEDLQQTQNGEE